MAYVFLYNIIMAFTVSFFYIFLLLMESKALEKSTKRMAACRFLACTYTIILRTVRICDVVNLFFFLNPFCFFLNMVSVSGRR